MLRFIFNSLLFLLAFSIVSIVIISWSVLPDLPETETLKNVKMQVPLRIYTADLSLIAEFGQKKRTPIDIKTINPLLINAFLAAEDDRFYEHPGFDWRGIVRAVYFLLKTQSKKQGGSTITMQVARNFFLSSEKTYIRKLKEIFLALKIEQELTKNEILELYLNKIYFGQRAYGIAAAAYVYYGKEVNSLSLSQIAMIAGLPKGPSATNPISDPEKALIRRNYVLKRMRVLNYITQEEFDIASNEPISATLHSSLIDVEAPYIAEMVRRDLVNKQGEGIYDTGLVVITTIRDKYQNAANLALRKALFDYDIRHGYRGAEHQIQYDETQSDEELAVLLKNFPIVGNLHPGIVTQVNERSITVFTSGIDHIEITWDGLKWARKYISENRRSKEPTSASEIIQVGDIIRLIETKTGTWSLSQIPKVEGSLVSFKPDDGALLALVGGFDFYRNKFNRVTQAKRQPGSAFKPFIYSAALAAGKTAATIINDAPIVFKYPGIEGEWRPENYSRKTYGPTRLREALAQSRNLVSIRLLESIGVPFALEHIKKFGFDTDRLTRNLSLSLGSTGVTPWELARAYCVFANGGYLIEPYYIKKITTYNGKLISQASPLSVCKSCTEKEKQNTLPDNNVDTITETAENKLPKTMDTETDISSQSKLKRVYAPRVVDARNIWIMNSMTRDVIKNGTGRRALQLNRHDLSGKTGTTNEQRDAWFSGFNSKIVAVSWVGFDQFKSLGNRETGAKAALPMWIDYMKAALQGMPEAIEEQPKGLINVRIDPQKGQLANANNPNAIFEVFRVENAPKTISRHKEPDIFPQKKDKNIIPEQLF